MIECETIRNKLFNIYGKKILCRIGMGDTTYNISAENYNQADMAVYIHERLRIVIVWNLEQRRKKNRVIKSLSINKEWSEIKPEKGEIKVIYKRMGTDSSAPFEKVLILDVDTMSSVLEDLVLFLKIDPEDEECPDEIKNGDLTKYDALSAELRRRVSTHRWERDRRFRNAVLSAYRRKCAICRCGEEKLLEAAHIKPISDGGNDDPKNGICLCANHHIMYDNGLITIDFKNNPLSYIEESVKTMSWYPCFVEEYSGKLLLPDHNDILSHNLIE